jgi:hypothetical protein
MKTTKIYYKENVYNLIIGFSNSSTDYYFGFADKPRVAFSTRLHEDEVELVSRLCDVASDNNFQTFIILVGEKYPHTGEPFTETEILQFLAHECCHVALDILKLNDFNLSYEEQEPLCRLMDEILNVVLTQGIFFINKHEDPIDPFGIATPSPQFFPGEECKLSPLGWRCTRGAGHDGPCAAWPDSRANGDKEANHG